MRNCLKAVFHCLGGRAGENLQNFCPEDDADESAFISGCLSRWITEIDQALSRQMDAIIHHPEFQKLESTWRGLRYLLDEAGGYLLPPPHSPGRTEVGRTKKACIRVKFFHGREDEWESDFQYAAQFDRSHFWTEIFAGEFDTAGGQPFGLVVCDYEINGLRSLRLMKEFSVTAQGAFCPVFFKASPLLFDIKDFSELARRAPEFNPALRPEIMSLRADRACSFAAVFLPRVRVRGPARLESSTTWPYREKLDTRSRDGALWGHAGWAYAAAVMKTFGETGWPYSLASLDDERARTPLGKSNGGEGGTFMTSEVYVGAKAAKALAAMGCVVASADRMGEGVIFPRPVVARLLEYGGAGGTDWMPCESSLPAMLAVCRFAHYLKIVARNELGTSKGGAAAVQSFISAWLKDYVSEREQDTVRPLVKQEVLVEDAKKGEPGRFSAKIRLWLKPVWGRRCEGRVDFSIGPDSV